MDDNSGRSTGGRLRIDFDDEPEVSGTGRERPGDGDVVLRSAALLWKSERIPIPAGGLFLGPGPGEIEEVASDDSVAEILPTGDGHVVVASSDDPAVYLNGEPLVEGERRPLGPGDVVASLENLVYYLPSGQADAKLPSIAPVEAGRVKASREEIVIGRDEHCDLTLDYPTVSRRHAVIKTKDGRAIVEDCGSATGLRVNGIPIRKRTDLETGDEIAIGPFRIVFDGEGLVERAAADGLPVEARGVSVTVGELQILQPTDLHLKAGEMVAFIGESGAGKTTLLKTLAGESTPTGGSILCGGEPVRSRLNEIGYVPQFDIVHGQLSVFEALDFAAQLRLPADITEEERHARVDEVIEQLGLTERADIRVDRLSGGQRKRVAVGIELLHRPGALFLDEPTTGLDPGLEQMMMRLFREIADTGKTVSLVTHATGSLGLCDRVVVMGRGGVKRFEGSPDELLDAFGVESFDEVYARMAEGFTPAVADGFFGAPPDPVEAPVPRRSRPQNKQGFGYQAAVLARRYLTLMSRDRRYLISLAVQTLVLGVMTAAIFEGSVFQFPPSTVKSLTGKAAQMIFLMVTISIWMGSIASAREIVKERSVIARECAIGVSIPAYIASKLIVLLGVVTAQVFVYFLIVLTIQPTHGGEITLLAILIGASWIAVMLGLSVSAWAQSEDQATGLIPILLVPQLIFGGALVTLKEMPGFVATLTSLIPARWAYDAAGTAVGMAQRLAPRDGEHYAQVALRDGYGSGFFHLEFIQFALIAAAFAVALCYLLAALIRRGLRSE